MNLTRDNLEELLVKLVPEIENSYSNLINWYNGEKPGLHIICGDILNPYIIERIKLKDKECLKRIFRFLEYMASSSDDYIQEVLVVTVLERLGDDDSVLQGAKVYMGPKTLKLSIDQINPIGNK